MRIAASATSWSRRMLAASATDLRTEWRAAGRFLLHSAVALPIVAVVAAELAHGWRPLFDDATIAWRSFDVLSAQSPLVGQETGHAGGPVLYGLGPLEYWFLAVPVHLDPAHGVLWGGAVVALAAISLGLEAARAGGGWAASAVFAACILVVLFTRPGIATDVDWNPWLGSLWMATAMAAAWATGTGRIGWWPVAVGAGSIAAQCHEIFALGAVALCVVSFPLGMWSRGSSPAPRSPAASRKPVMVGLMVGLVAWSAPLVQEMSSPRGNLSSLLSYASQGRSTFGIHRALAAMAAAVRPWPDWLRALPRSDAQTQLNAFFASFRGPRAWAVAVLFLLTAIAVSAWTLHRRRLASLALVALVSAGTFLWSFTFFPLQQYMTLGYLDVAWWLVGMATFMTFAGVVVPLAAGFAGRARGFAGRARGLVGRARYRRFGGFAAAGLLSGLSLWTLAFCLPQAPSALAADGGYRSAHLVSRTSVAIARRVPSNGPAFLLEVTGGPSPAIDFAVLTGTAYRLHAAGRPVRLLGLAAGDFGPASRASDGIPALALRLPRRWQDPQVDIVALPPAGAPIFWKLSGKHIPPGP